MIIYGGRIFDSDHDFCGYIEIDNGLITNISEGIPDSITIGKHTQQINAEGKYVLPGIIDSHVHFREPGLTHKADIASESLAALAGGVTTFFDMPNTKPVTDSLEHIRVKQEIADRVSPIDGRFFIAATNSNIDYLEHIELDGVPGVKLFMGTSTGNMAVGSDDLLHRVFALPKLIMIHAEDDDIISLNAKKIGTQYPEGEIPIHRHPDIRSREACISATRKALELARQHNTRLHIAHVSTREEVEMIARAKAEGLRVTAEACILHLMFDRSDYERLGATIKCNPAIKEYADRQALIQACAQGIIDTVSTDHAPHLWSEKKGDALHAASGAPSVQFSLLSMLELAVEGKLSIAQITRLMCHNQADIFGLTDRGYLKAGLRADIVVVTPHAQHTIMPTDILSKCGWSPFLGHTFSHVIGTVIVNGKIAYSQNK